jgi:hypothetical protein
MIELLLSGVFYTHLWMNNQNTFVKICEYRAERNVSISYYYSPHRIWIYDWQTCPRSQKVNSTGTRKF